MTLKKHFILSCATLCVVACSDQPPITPVAEIEEQNPGARYYLMNTNGDTIPTGVPVTIEEKVVKKGTFAGRPSGSMRSNGEEQSARPYRLPAPEPKMAPLLREAVAVIPGENGALPPDTLSVNQFSIPALSSKPVAASPLQMQDNAFTNIQYLSVEEGLTDYYIHSILEDRRGYLWLNTTNGTLTRYDGRQLTFFPSAEQYPAHTFTKHSLEDAEGNLWFGTRTGLARYDGNRFTYFEPANGYQYNGVTTLLQDRRGRIWFGTSDRGLGCLDLSEEKGRVLQYTTASGMTHNQVLDLLQDERGRLWIGTGGGGAMRFDGRQFTHLTTEDGLSHNVVNTVLEDSRGRIWFGTEGGGASRLDDSTLMHYTTREGLSGNLIRDIYEDSNGDFWFATYDNGLTRLQDDQFTHYGEKNGMKSAQVNTVIEDSYGNIWVGTNEGVHLIGFPAFTHYTALLGDAVNAIVEDDSGRIWFGMSGRHQNDMVCLDDQVFRHYSGQGASLKFIQEGVYSLSKDSGGYLWSGNGDRGTIRFDPHSARPRLTQYDIGEGWNNFLLSILEDAEGRFWFGTFDGMNHFDGKTMLHYPTPAAPGLDYNLVHSLVEDDDGNIWFGHPQYLGRYQDSSFIFYTKNEGLPHNMVHAILKDSRGDLWVGTDGGLSRYNGKTFSNFTVEDGLNNDRVYSLAEDKLGRIWAGTQNGLAVLVPIEAEKTDTGQDKQRDFRIYNFGKPDGLKQADFLFHSVCVDRQNRIWWGKTRGAMMLELDQFEVPEKLPLVHLDHIEINQEYIDFRQLRDTEYQASSALGRKLRRAFSALTPFFNYPSHMTLPYRLNDLTFQFSGIDWAAPQKIQYSFWLEGIDEDWSVPQPEAKVEYRNLPHGDYVLKVRARGAALRWSAPFDYAFSIRPPWWHTGWAYAIYVLAVFSLLTGLYGYQRRRWQLQTQLEVEREKAERIIELDRFKSRFYTNITHEFRTPLTVIKGMAGQLEGQEKAKTLIQRNSDRLLQMVNQLLDLSRLETNSLPVHWVQADVISYLNYLTESCHSLAGDKKINLAFFSSEDSLVMDFDEEKLQQILLNLISNAIRYTPAYGSVKVAAGSVLESAGPYLELVVQDTGRGIAQEQLPRIFERFYRVDEAPAVSGEGAGIGLALVQELVQLLEGRIEVESEPGKGALFRVLLPIHQRAPEKESPDWKASFAAAEAGGSSAAPDSEAPPSGEGEGPLLLIIEDNADVVDYLSLCLADHCRLLTARNGRDGLEKAVEHIPDVVLCDVMMPELDGFETCRRLKEDRRTSHIPIILLTARATQEDKVKGLTHGADAYLTKPFDKKELLVRLENLAALSQRLKDRLTASEASAEPSSESERREAAFLREVDQIIADNLHREEFNTYHLCRAVAMSRTQLHRKLKALTGWSTAAYIRMVRLRQAKSLLETTDLPVGEIALQVGFHSFSHFSRSFAKEFGISPSETRK